jgi:hypothetical protein
VSDVCFPKYISRYLTARYDYFNSNSRVIQFGYIERKCLCLYSIEKHFRVQPLFILETWSTVLKWYCTKKVIWSNRKIYWVIFIYLSNVAKPCIMSIFFVITVHLYKDTKSEWLLFNANSAIFQLYHGENKLIFNEMLMRSALY